MDIEEKSPLVTVITVCFNESPARIRRTFNNVSEQSYKNIEWIVIDGGSNSETIDAIGEYASFITTFVSEKDDGLYYAMNKGVALATGEWVNFMNVGDSFAEKDSVAKVVGVINNSPGYDCYHGDKIDVDDEDNARWVCQMPHAYNKQVFHDQIVSHQSLFARRSVFDLVGGFDTSYRIAADKEWMVRTTLAGVKGLHTGLVISRSNGNLSSNLAQCCQEEALIQRRYYTSIEHAILSIRWIFIKGIMRFRSRNFKVPNAWRNSV